MNQNKKNSNKFIGLNTPDQDLDFLLSTACQEIKSHFTGIHSFHYQFHGKNEHGTELDHIYLSAALYSTYKPYYTDTIYNTAQNFIKNAYIDREKRLYLVNHQGHKAKLTLDYIALIRGVHFIEDLFMKKIGDDPFDHFVEKLNTNLDNLNHTRLLGLGLFEIYHTYQKELGLTPDTIEHQTRHHKLFTTLQKIKIPEKYLNSNEFKNRFPNVVATLS